MVKALSALIVAIIIFIVIIVTFIIETKLGNIVIDPVITTVDTTITNLPIDESAPFHDSLNILFICFWFGVGILLICDGLFCKFEFLRSIVEILVAITNILSSLFSR